MRLAYWRGHGGHAGLGVLEAVDRIRPIAGRLSDLLHADDPPAAAAAALAAATGPALAVPDQVVLDTPIDAQEVWAAGVTYLRSKTARESESTGAARFYDLVYTAPRPELFFKATARRVVGPGSAVRARADSRWSVPEPELALVISPAGRIVGYTLGNDMSARDIEGENPLYLPQAKLYRQSCAIGPAVVLTDRIDPAAITLSMTIRRDGATAFSGATPFTRFVRKPEELVDWLFRDNEFPDGVILLTGTGIVPPDDFTLRPGDEIEISEPGVGTLVNPVVIG
jgi:2-dehydro-3-deoxy-D-arabinonate dehydratase